MDLHPRTVRPLAVLAALGFAALAAATALAAVTVYKSDFSSKREARELRPARGGGSDFPAKGTKSAIENVGKPNVLRLAAVGDHVTAKVNGKRVARATDSKPSQVNGRNLEVAVGNKKRSDRAVLATIDDLKLQ